MNTLSRKEIFKFIIKEFHSSQLPVVISRDLKVPLFSEKIITLFGPRRGGKSFYLFSLIKTLAEKHGIKKERIVYINFEDDRLLPLTVKDLQFLIDAYYELYPDYKGSDLFFLFDEIQNIDGWETFVRRIYEKEKIRIFITGSSSKLLSREISTSLRGRTVSYPLYPLNFNEFLRFKGLTLEKNFQYTPLRFKIKNLLDEYIEWGIFPEIAKEQDAMLRKKILSEYFHMLVFRDIGERFALSNTDMLKDLLKFLFTDITSCFSVNSYYNLAKQTITMSRETVTSYLSHIEESQYFFLLPVFSYSLKVQKVNPKKVICLDTGLRNVIAFRFSADKGKLAENMVGSVLKTRGYDPYYWKNKREVDFVVKEDSDLTGINVCYSNMLKEREIDSLLEFRDTFKNVKKLLLITEDTEKEEGKISFVPLWKWLLNERIKGQGADFSEHLEQN